MDSGTWWPLIGGRSKRTNTLGPVAQGGIADISLPQGLGATIVDIVSDFSGGDLSYSLAPSSDTLPAGLQFNQNGTITGTPTDLTPGRFIVIRASNTFGFADSGFVLEVVALSFTPELTGLTNNPTHGLSAQTGAQLTANAVDFNGPPPNAVTYQWETAESGPIPGATNANYTPDASANDGESLFCRIEADFYPTQVSDSFVIRQVPPTAQGALFDEILDLGSGPELYNVALDFTGVALEYSVAGPGTSIDAQTGLLTIQTNSPVVGAVVAVTATNSGGTAQSAFLLTVEDAGIGPGPDISNPVLDSIQDTIAFSLEFAGTVYWRRDATGTNP
ncbi:MAG: Ig domain-containing protein, partial [Pseudomonadota bacterium]